MDPYNVALTKAQKELAKCDAEAEELERKRARLRQTIASLQSTMGISVQSDESMTETILMVLKAWPGAATVSEVTERLIIFGFQAQTASVATILSRLAKNGKIESLRDQNGSGKVGYGWKKDLSKPEREAARRTLAAKAGKKS